VAWRETTKKSLGKARYIFRVFVLVLVPTTFFGFLVISDTSRGGSHEGAAFLFPLYGRWRYWFVHSGANAISSERSSQTLDVLLVTPMTGRDIIRQKTQALQRLTQALALVFLTVFAMEAWCASTTRRTAGCLWSLSVSLLVYLPMIIWISVWIACGHGHDFGRS